MDLPQLITVVEMEAQVHYDLGLAYKAMGLHTDAIAEFELAARDASREGACHAQMGLIHRERGALAAALEAFLRALRASNITRTEELEVAYELADAYEAHGAPRKARRYFQRVARLDPTYSDPRGTVTDRLRRLTPDDEPA